MNARLRISPRTMSRIGRWFTVTGYWLRGAAPMAAAVFAALFLFQDAIFDSILSTPNPALVYMIFCVLAVGAIFTLGVLGSFIRIESIALRWHAESDNAGFRAKVMNNVHVGLLRPILALLTGERALTGRMRQVAIENELKVIEKRLSDRLNLPNWIAGALVGLGLVGTFVGLLGTLEDLGKLFASLGTSGAPGTDAGVMFGDMVRRLQAPMRGMGTAFVASLYGLLGSLLLGLMVLSVRKTGSLVIDRLRWLVREESFGNEGEVQSAEPAPRLGQPSGMSPDHWADMIEAMRSQHAAVVIQTGTMNEEISRIGQMLQTQQQAISAESSAVHDEVTRLGEMLQFQQEAVAADSASARKEVARISEMMRAMTLAMHERTQVDLQIQSLMDSGVHWADSWSQINEQLISIRAADELAARKAAQLQSEQLDALNRLAGVLTHIEAGVVSQSARLGRYIDERDQTHEMELRTAITISREMQDSLQACRYEFEHATSKLRSVLAAQRDVDRRTSPIPGALEASRATTEESN